MLGDGLVILTFSVLVWMLFNAITSQASLNAEAILVRRRSWGWIRLLYGLILLLDVIGTVQRQVSGCVDPRYRAANGAEMLGMVIGYLALISTALWLIVSGYRRIADKFQESQEATAPQA